MKKVSLLLVSVVACLLCYAQPEIKFESTTYDFGKIKEEGGKVTGKFIFTNVGNEPLELTNVRPGCGCTAANYTKGAIAPGEPSRFFQQEHPRDDQRASLLGRRKGHSPHDFHQG